MPKPSAGAVFGLTLALASSGWAATPLADLKGKSRVLVVSAPSPADPGLARQDQWLRAGGAGLRDRDVVVIRIVAGSVEGLAKLKLDAGGVRRALGLQTDRFGVALVGKDGSEAFQRSEPITLKALFSTIDAMPMRRKEIERRKS